MEKEWLFYLMIGGMVIYMLIIFDVMEIFWIILKWICVHVLFIFVILIDKIYRVLERIVSKIFDIYYDYRRRH